MSFIRQILYTFLRTIGLVSAKDYDTLLTDYQESEKRAGLFLADYKRSNKECIKLVENNKKINVALSFNPKAQKIIKKEQESKAKLKAWSLRVRKIGKCDVCENAENLSAHHLYDKNTHPTLRYQDENGVCLCITCHNNFHKMYTGASQTTPSQYNKFKIIELNKLK